MPKPICVSCRVEMVVERNGETVRDRASEGFPSTYWSGDRFSCPSCGAEIVTGFGNKISDPTRIEEKFALEFDRRNALVDPEPAPEDRPDFGSFHGPLPKETGSVERKIGDPDDKLLGAVFSPGCDCQLEGKGTIPDPIRIRFCETHKPLRERTVPECFEIAAPFVADRLRKTADDVARGGAPGVVSAMSKTGLVEIDGEVYKLLVALADFFEKT